MKESWDEVYNAVDTNEKYNLFFSKLSIHFNACFPLKKRKLNISSKSNTWITQGIRTSCKTNVRFTLFLNIITYHPVSIYTSENIKEFKKGNSSGKNNEK